MFVKVIKIILFTLKILFIQGCLLADQTFPESIFPSHACWKCYENLIDKGRLIKVGCKIIHERQNYTVPGFVVDADCVPFDHRDKSISALVQRSLTNSTFEKWQKCCNEAINCCHMMIKSYQVENFLNTCDAHFSIDGNCFLDTRPGMNVKKMCPFHLTRYDSSKCNRKFIFNRLSNSAIDTKKNNLQIFTQKNAKMMAPGIHLPIIRNACKTSDRLLTQFGTFPFWVCHLLSVCRRCLRFFSANHCEANV